METFSHQTARLAAGRHSSPDDGVCVMELASILAGERFSDNPQSVSASIAALLRGYNDGLDDARRQTLKRFAAEAIGTTGDRVLEKHRRQRIGSAIGETRASHGFGGRLLRGITGADPYSAARATGKRVAEDGDDRLHASVLSLVDELVQMGLRGRAGLPRLLTSNDTTVTR